MNKPNSRNQRTKKDLILLVDVSEENYEDVERSLEVQDYKVEIAEGDEQGLDFTKRLDPGLIIYDTAAKPLDMGEFIKKARTYKKDVPVIVVSEDDSLSTLTYAFEAGASDFMSKPINKQELLLRIAARLEPFRRKAKTKRKLRYEGIVLDKDKKTVYRDREVVELTPREYSLLELLLENTNNVLSRDYIMSRVWKDYEYVDERIVDVYVGYLRKKIDKPFGRNTIKTKRGFGYYLGPD